MMLRPARKRPGLSLLEILTALAIFLLSVVAINQIVESGSRAALRSQRLSRAALLSESVMSELVAGATPLQSVDGAPLSDAGTGWTYSVACVPEDWSALPVAGQTVHGLYSVQVTVTYSGRGGDGVEYTLTRLVLDPQLRFSATQ